MPIHGYPGNVITANPVAPTASVASGVWTTEQQLLAVSQGNWPGYEYPISRSLRFNSADSAYIVRQNGGTAGNRKVWTLSFWMKPSVISTAATPGDGPHLFMVGNTNPNGGGGPSTYSRFLLTGSSNNLVWGSNGSSGEAFTSTNVFRDLSAWYHVVVSFDATNTIIRCYVNNQEITYASRTNPSNTDSAINAANYYNSFGIFHTGDVRGWNGYLTEFNFIDGQALTPSSFGLNDPETGVWSPKRYTGTYGTNGFYLNFSDNSGTTSTTIGKDYSGNGNNWTPNNFSVTAGVNNDSMVDSPTSYGTDTGVGGEVRGNYCTLNPLQKTPDITTVNNGNLFASLGGGYYNFYGILATQSAVTQKSYFEANFTANRTLASNLIGVIDWASETNKALIQTSGGTGSYFSSAWSHGAGNYVRTGSTSTTDGVTYTSSDTLMVAFDPVLGKVWFGKNGTWNSSSDPATNTGGYTISSYSGAGLFPYCTFNPDASTDSTTFNFGQRAFAYTAPSGFKALCTQNLPTPTIGATSTTQAGKYFNPVLYSGNSSTQAITGVGFQPDFVWCKARSTAAHGIVTDAVRTAAKVLSPSQTAAESAWADNAFFQSLNSDGFTLTGGGTGINTTGNTYVAWNWKANGAGSSNTAGTITSTVSANTTSGFSIVTYTGNGSAGATVGHGLGVTPGMIIVKSRSVGTGDWVVWHSSLTSSNNNYLILNSTAAVNTANQPWNNTLPTSSVFSLRTWDSVNQNASTYVAYLFAAVAGYSAFGSYTGNASADGPFIYTGFRPEFVMIKCSSTTGDWVMQDVARSPYNVSTNYLVANASTAEQTGQLLDFVSNGFKIRVAVSGAMNSSGATYIFMAFAENPFKYALAR